MYILTSIEVVKGVHGQMTHSPPGCRALQHITCSSSSSFCQEAKRTAELSAKKKTHALLNMNRSVNHTTTNHLSRQFVRFCCRLNERNEPRERPIKRQHFSLPQFYARKNVSQHLYVFFFFYVIGNSCVKL